MCSGGGLLNTEEGRAIFWKDKTRRVLIQEMLMLTSLVSHWARETVPIPSILIGLLSLTFRKIGLFPYAIVLFYMIKWKHLYGCEISHLTFAQLWFFIFSATTVILVLTDAILLSIWGRQGSSFTHVLRQVCITKVMQNRLKVLGWHLLSKQTRIWESSLK